MVGELPGRQRRHVEIALVGQSEFELQTGDDLSLGRGEEVVLAVAVHADFEGDVGERSDVEGLGVEDLVEAEGRAEQAVDLGRPGAIGGRAGDQHAGIGARRSGVVLTRLEHRDREEVGAVGPDVEVGERVDLLGRRAVDRTVRLNGVRAGIGALGHPGEGHAVIDQQEERQFRRGLRRFDREVGRTGESGGRKCGK